MADEEQPKTLEVVPANKAAELTEMDLHRHELSYFRGVPASDPVNKMYAIATAIREAAYIPPVARGNTGSIFFMIMRGHELGIPWTVSVGGGLYPIARKGRDGEEDTIRLGIEGHVALSLLLNKGFKCKVLQSDEKIAEWWLQRPDASFEFQDSFTIEEARTLDLLKKPNWKYPKDMLRWRALMRVARIVSADLLGGMHLPDEIELEADLNGNYSLPAPSEPENRFTVGRKPAPGSDAEFSQAARSAASADEHNAMLAMQKGETKPAPVETPQPKEETPEVKPTPKASSPETAKPASPNAGPKACGCVAPACMMLEDGKITAGRFCREGRTLGASTEPIAEPVAQSPSQQVVPDDPATTLRKQVIGMLTAMTDNYSEHPPKTVMSKFNNFFRGALGVKDLPKDPQTFQGLIPALKAAITSDKDAFWKDPTGAGRIEAEDRKFIAEKLTAWKWNVALMPLILKVKYFFLVTGVDVCDYIEKSHELTKVAPAAAEAFLKMAAISREAYRVKPIAKWSKLGYDELLQHMQEKMEKPIEQFTEKELVGLIKIGESTMAEETNKDKAPAPPVTKPEVGPVSGQTTAEPEQGGLPWDTEA